MSYFVVMCDYGRLGRESVVDPNMSRSNVVDMIASKEWENVLWVHEIHADGSWSDLTASVLEDAGVLAPDEVTISDDRMAWQFDHARDLRKHEVVS